MKHVTPEPDPELYEYGHDAYNALRVFELHLERVHKERGQRETAALLGVAHTTYARWMRGGLSMKLGLAVARLGADLRQPTPLGAPELPKDTPIVTTPPSVVEREIGRVTYTGGGERVTELPPITYKPRPSSEPKPSEPADGSPF